MAIQYSIQKMVSDGTLSTIALGIQYLQRNDVYMRIAGEETPQSGAPSGYTWSFINNTTLKILPVVPNGVEVVVYRRTDIDAMYNIYSQNAQFDEATIDENNQQLLYIAQEYLEQGIPGAGVDTLEFVRDDGTYTYYRIKRTDGSYSDEFAVPSASSSTKVLTRESLRRSYAEAGFNLVEGSFEAGGTLTAATDVLLQESTGATYAWTGALPKVVAPGFDPVGVVGFELRTDVVLRNELARLSVGTASELSALTSSDIGKRVQWMGYYSPSDGGSNWGIVKSGSHVADGGSIFSISPTLYVEANTKGKRITLKKFGCKQDGVTDDTQQFYKAIEFASNNNLILECGNLPTLVQDSAVKTFVSTTPVKIHNLNIIAGTTYANQPRLKFDSDVEYEIKNFKVSGGRGTKSGLEPWRKFTAFLGYDSIEPTTGSFITIGGSLLTSNITIEGVDARDCHYESIIIAYTAGVIDAKRFHFENCSNKQIHFWHGMDGGAQPLTGVTNLSGYVARDCGILPASFTVDGVAKTRADSVAPQGAFGCIVSYGTFNHSDVFVHNYGSTGVTPDRNITAMGRNIKIWNDDANAFSNNSSGAYWDEYCGNCTVAGLEIRISARDARETPLENCCLQIYKQTYGIFSASNVVIETSSNAHMDKDIRGSLSAGSQVSINDYSMESNASNTSISMLQISGLNAKIELKGGRVRGAPMRITQSQNLLIDGLDSDQNLTINQGLPAAIGDVTLTDVDCATLNINGSAGSVKINGGSASSFVTGGANGSLSMDGGFRINGISEITGYNSLHIGDMETSRRCNILDVKRMKSVGSIFKTDQPEHCLRIAPSAGIMKQATLIGVSCWIKTGTAGAGYTAAWGMANLTEISPDNQTFAWE